MVMVSGADEKQNVEGKTLLEMKTSERGNDGNDDDDR